jgi:histone deacetylase complex regulatory component SIN3
MRVQKLFGNEPDLLDEFKYFLPDNTAPQHSTPNKRQSSKKKAAAVRSQHSLSPSCPEPFTHSTDCAG